MAALGWTATATAIQGIAEALAPLDRDNTTKVRQLLNAVGLKTVAYLRSQTSERRPPVRAGGNERPAHPGHWADISGQLAASYDKDVQETPGGYRLVMTNSAEYAAALEARDGFFVLSGVTDPGGPLEVALRQAVATIAPEWTVTVYP